MLVGGGMDPLVFHPDGGNDVVAGFQNNVDLPEFRAFTCTSKAGDLNLAS